MQKLGRFALIWTGLVPALLLARSGGPGPGYSGAPGDTTCVACHGGSPNSFSGNVAISFEGTTTYTPGQTVHVTVTVTDPEQKRWGFQVSPRLASDAQSSGAGTLEPVDGNTQLTAASGTIQWIQHTAAGTRNGTTGGVSFNFEWQPPATNQGDVTFYVAANAANGDGTNQGDHIYTTVGTLKAAANPSKPSISAQNGVLNGADFSPAIAPGAWFSIFGTNFSSTTRLWEDKDFVDDKLPTSLDGVSVTVNGKPAAIYYISSTQINAQAPDDSSLGPVDVVVTTPNGTSDPVSVMLQTEAPALFAFSPQSSRYAAAVATDGTYLGPAGLFGVDVTTRPAHGGEIISLFGNGFGATSPPVATGFIFSGAAQLTHDVTVTVGGVDAEVSFAGLAATSLYQFNVKVPAGLPDGDQKVLIMIDGRQTQDNLFLATQQ